MTDALTNDPVTLLPAEKAALTVGLAQVLRGDEPTFAVASMCVLALARVVGKHDWTSEMLPALQETQRG